MKLHTTLAALGLAAAICGAAYAQVVQGLDGRWEGQIALPDGAKLNGVFRVETKDGKTAALMDSPDQGAFGFEATASRTGAKVVLAVPEVSGDFTGDLSADGKTLTGNWNQLGQSLPLVLTKK